MTVPATPPQGHAIPDPPPAARPWATDEAESLLRTLPGVVSARLVRDETGSVREAHLLTTTAVAPKQVVRNVESAMLARFGARIDHRTISVAQSVPGREAPLPVAPQTPVSAPLPAASAQLPVPAGRGVYFEDVEVRRSRTHGLSCTVTLRAGPDRCVGEATGRETSHARGALAARAAVTALAPLLADGVALAFESFVTVEACDRTFAFVVVSGQAGREATMLSGSCEIREGTETAAVLAVLDATERWMERSSQR